jgi:hypothetical protein
LEKQLRLVQPGAVANDLARLAELAARPTPFLDVTIPVSVYSSDDEEPAEVVSALDQLLAALGWALTEDDPPIHGSWFGAFRGRSKREGATDKLSDLAAKLERAGELKYIQAVRAESDEREANAVATLVTALDNLDNAVVRLSSILFVKNAGVLTVLVLTETQIRKLDENPRLLRSPAEILEAMQPVDEQPVTGTVQVPGLSRHLPPAP